MGAHRKKVARLVALGALCLVLWCSTLTREAQWVLPAVASNDQTRDSEPTSPLIQNHLVNVTQVIKSRNASSPMVAILHMDLGKREQAPSNRRSVLPMLPADSLRTVSNSWASVERTVHAILMLDAILMFTTL